MDPSWKGQTYVVKRFLSKRQTKKVVEPPPKTPEIEPDVVIEDSSDSSNNGTTSIFKDKENDSETDPDNDAETDSIYKTSTWILVYYCNFYSLYCCSMHCSCLITVFF